MIPLEQCVLCFRIIRSDELGIRDRVTPHYHWMPSAGEATTPIAIHATVCASHLPHIDFSAARAATPARFISPTGGQNATLPDVSPPIRQTLDEAYYRQVAHFLH